MKTIRIITVVLSLVFSGTIMEANHSIVSSFGFNKTPWQKLMTVVYSHGQDTSNLTIMDSPDSSLLRIITPELSRTFDVKTEMMWGTRVTLYGEILSAYMKEAYKNKDGEKYDYYKTRYSTDEQDYLVFLEKYPDSRYTEEMTQKEKCVEAYWAWVSAYSDNDCHVAYLLSKHVKCPYEGFEKITKHLTRYIETVDKWDALNKERIASNNFDCSKYNDFIEQNKGYLAAYNWIAKDSMMACEWNHTVAANTISAYRKFKSQYPDSSRVCDIAIADLQSFANAKKIGTHQAYAQYYVKQILKDNSRVPLKAIEAYEAMQKIEQPYWDKISNSSNWYDYSEYMCKYPMGAYYINAGLSGMGVVLEKVDTNAKGWFSKKGKGLLFLANTSKMKENVTFEVFNKKGKLVSKNTLKPGQHIEKELPVGEYFIYYGKRETEHYTLNMGQYIYAITVFEYDGFDYKATMPALPSLNFGNNRYLPQKTANKIEEKYEDKNVVEKINNIIGERSTKEVEILSKTLEQAFCTYLDITPDEYEAIQQLSFQVLNDFLQQNMDMEYILQQYNEQNQ